MPASSKSRSWATTRRSLRSPGEIVPCNEFYDYDAKYVDDGSELIVPADVPSDVVHRDQDLAIRAFTALDLAGLARVDFFLERGTGEIYLNEVNTIPGFTSISMYPMLWEASGIPLAELVERLIALAIDATVRKTANRPRVVALFVRVDRSAQQQCILAG